MSRDKHFFKFEALGNDFVLLDHRDGAPDPTDDFIRSLADRHRGIGFDQLLIVKETSMASADVKVTIFNQDGGSAAQCGNGIRAVARWLQQQHPDRKSFVLDTEAGLIATEDQGEEGVRVAMGQPRFGPSAIGFDMGVDLSDWTKEVNGLMRTGMISMGNPHLILQLEQAASAGEVAHHGQHLGSCPGFKHGVNVSFTWLDADQLVKLRVHERGVGPTLACGSAACATAAFLIHAGQVESPVHIDQPGGRLVIDWRPDSDTLFMTGPARQVFDGILVE